MMITASGPVDQGVGGSEEGSLYRWRSSCEDDFDYQELKWELSIVMENKSSVECFCVVTVAAYGYIIGVFWF